jgi:hypothetical protein
MRSVEVLLTFHVSLIVDVVVSREAFEAAGGKVLHSSQYLTNEIARCVCF